MNIFLSYTHYKLNFKVYRSKTCYFVNKLATIIYSNYLFHWGGRIQFLIDNSSTSFSQVGEADVEQLSQKVMDWIDKAKSKKKSTKKPRSISYEA